MADQIKITHPLEEKKMEELIKCQKTRKFVLLIMVTLMLKSGSPIFLQL